jgi:hypothetical protein
MKQRGKEGTNYRELTSPLSQIGSYLVHAVFTQAVLDEHGFDSHGRLVP